MKPTEQQAPGQPDPARRQFLKAAPLGALAVVAGAAPAAEAAPAATAAAAPVQGGYHETEHIRRYYATAAYW
jgi:nitrous oxide reductase